MYRVWFLVLGYSTWDLYVSHGLCIKYKTHQQKELFTVKRVVSSHQVWKLTPSQHVIAPMSHQGHYNFILQPQLLASEFDSIHRILRAHYFNTTCQINQLRYSGGIGLGRIQTW